MAPQLPPTGAPETDMASAQAAPGQQPAQLPPPGQGPQAQQPPASPDAAQQSIQGSDTPPQQQPNGSVRAAPPQWFLDATRPDMPAATTIPQDRTPYTPPTATMVGRGGENPMSGDVPAQQASSQQVTPEEQKQYDDFVSRCLLFLNDPRLPMANGKPVPNRQAPRDAIISLMNADKNDAADAVGRATALVCRLIYSNAKQKGVDYSPDVIYHGADEVMSQLYQIATAARIIKNPPPDGSPQEQSLLGKAKLDATKYFGQWMIDTGQDDDQTKQQAQQYYLGQIQREGQSGELDRWNPAEQFTPGQLNDFLAKAASGQGALNDGTRTVPRTPDDFKALGMPSMMDAGMGQQGGPQQVPGGQTAPGQQDQSQQGASAPAGA